MDKTLCFISSLNKISLSNASPYISAKNIVDSRVGGTEEGNSEEEEDAKEAAKYGKGCPEGAKRQQEAKCETDVVNPEED